MCHINVTDLDVAYEFWSQVTGLDRRRHWHDRPEEPRWADATRDWAETHQHVDLSKVCIRHNAKTG